MDNGINGNHHGNEDDDHNCDPNFGTEIEEHCSENNAHNVQPTILYTGHQYDDNCIGRNEQGQRRDLFSLSGWFVVLQQQLKKLHCKNGACNLESQFGFVCTRSLTRPPQI